MKASAEGNDCESLTRPQRHGEGVSRVTGRASRGKERKETGGDTEPSQRLTSTGNNTVQWRIRARQSHSPPQ